MDFFKSHYPRVAIKLNVNSVEKGENDETFQRDTNHKYEVGHLPEFGAPEGTFQNTNTEQQMFSY
jgi:hypothetical protein